MVLPDDVALIGGRLFEGLTDLTSDLSALDSGGQWVVVLPFDGPPVCARFRDVQHRPGALAPGSPPKGSDVPLALGRSSGAGGAGRSGRPGRPGRSGPSGRSDRPVGEWSGIPRSSWRSSLDQVAFGKGVRAIREAIAEGDVYQVNLCRKLSAPLPERRGADVVALGALLARAHPAPHAAIVRLPSAGVAVASASPERFLRRDGRTVESRPIKGTAATGSGFSPKDRAENVMIVDLVRNDLGRVCEYGSVEVPALCAMEEHPGLCHLVSTVQGRLRPDVGWAELVAATFPPGSVTGAPKLAALEVIRDLEPVPRGVYCGAVGWVDADRGEGDLNVAIRTFWIEHGQLHLGVGGGITWDSTPEGEWQETELKAARLLSVVGAAA